MRIRARHPLFILGATLAVTAIGALPAQAVTSSVQPFPPVSSSVPGTEKVVLVLIPGYGPYLLSPEVQGAGLNPGNADQEDLLSAAVLSADFEGNTAARDAALQALGPQRNALLAAALRSLHSPVTAPGTDASAPIVVLGNGLNPDGSVHPNLRNRLLAAKQLADARPTAPVLVSGGVTGQGHVEAEVMRDWLLAEGVSAQRIILEPRAGSTVQNARFSRALLPAATSVIIVTSDNHLSRAAFNFTLAFGPDVTVTGVGSPTEPPEGTPGPLWSYRDGVQWFLG